MSEYTEQIQFWLEESLAASVDFVTQELTFNGNRVLVYYMKSIIDEKKLQKLYIVPFFTQFLDMGNYLEYIRSLSTLKDIPGQKELLQFVLRGTAIVFVNDEIVLADVRNNVNTSISEATVENTVQGPKQSFSEDLAVNINLLRFRYSQPSLTTEHAVVGTLSQTPVTLIYDEQLVNKNVLKELKNR